MGDGVRPGLDTLGHVEDRPVVGLHLGLRVLGHLGENVPSAMDEAALPQRGTDGPLDRADQPGRAVRDDEQRAAEPALTEVGKQPGPGVAGLGRGGVQADEHRPTVGADAHPASTCSAAALAW